MADAPHAAEVHRLVDRLSAGQVEALYVILRGMLPDAGDSPESVLSDKALQEAPAEWSPSADAPVVRTLSIAGIARGDHDLAARSQEILWQELGHADE
jgi:hypothetical protein